MTIGTIIPWVRCYHVLYAVADSGYGIGRLSLTLASVPEFFFLAFNIA
ncbi:hypothetical protein [Paenibacillus chitinolyticus]